jgi:hypothetical protein
MPAQDGLGNMQLLRGCRIVQMFGQNNEFSQIFNLHIFGHPFSRFSIYHIAIIFSAQDGRPDIQFYFA